MQFQIGLGQDVEITGWPIYGAGAECQWFFGKIIVVSPGESADISIFLR